MRNAMADRLAGVDGELAGREVGDIETSGGIRASVDLATSALAELTVLLPPVSAQHGFADRVDELDEEGDRRPAERAGLNQKVRRRGSRLLPS
jgi:hypothetical protein